MSNLKPIMKSGTSNQNNPMELFQPFNIIVFLSFYSPIILAASITSLSFTFQNFKGFIYLGFLLGVCIVRNYIYELNGGQPLVFDKTLCTAIQFSKFGNSSFSSFVFAFTMAYLFIPMFTNGGPNFWIFSSILVYFFLDLYIKLYKKCLTSMGDLFINVLLGVASSAVIVSLMYAGGSGKYLFFNEISSDKEICYQPKNQTFKCSVYKNGEIIANI